MFKLEAQGLELNIAIESIDRVSIHEEIVPELLDELMREIKSSGAARDPVIVDSGSRVVLDGMHRVAALRELGCRCLPVCLVDYRSPKVRVGCWYRTIKGEVGEVKFLNIFKLLGLEVRHSSLEEAVRALEDREATAALLTQRTCRLLKAPRTEIVESHAWVKRLERAFREEGFGVGYERESDAEELVRSGEVAAALLVPQVRKAEVLEAASSGNVFAHKTTRHVMPARPVNVMVPLEWLTGDKSLEELNRALVGALSKRRLERLPRGAEFEGRRYDEELLIFR